MRFDHLQQEELSTCVILFIPEFCNTMEGGKTAVD